MSYVPPEQLEGSALIVQFVVECRGKGHFLSDDDHAIIQKWLYLSEDAEMLLLILSEFLPDFYKKSRNLANPPSLKRIDRKINLLLSEKNKRRSPH